MPQLNGPIPGENFTSDTKNYPWHRPPEYTDLDKAIEAASKKLLSEESALGLTTMLKQGTTVATLTDMFLTSGIGAGKWTVDFALLMAGPVSHIIYLMAKADGIDCDLGLKSKAKPITSAFFDEIKLDRKKTKEMVEQLTPEVLDQMVSSVKDTGPKGGLANMNLGKEI